MHKYLNYTKKIINTLHYVICFTDIMFQLVWK